MSELWPFEALAVRTPLLELRWPSPADLYALAELAVEGVHDPDFQPFTFPWTDAAPTERGRSVLQWFWRQAGAIKPETWVLNLVTVVHGTVVGTQGLDTIDFPTLREAETGSWLGRAHQGRGIGTEMRSAIVHLAFEGLGAEHVVSSAYTDNGPSLGVSRKVGYAEDGIIRKIRRGRADTLIRLRLTRSDWEARRRTDISITGLEECLPLLGLSPGDRR
jgi:RimJ/RimL family protein N-acetyltransferase